MRRNPFEKPKPLTSTETERMSDDSKELELQENRRSGIVNNSDKPTSAWEGRINEGIIRDDHSEYGENSSDEK